MKKTNQTTRLILSRKMQIIMIICNLLFISAKAQPSGWVQKADFGGTGRTQAVSFSIGTKGYLGTGSGNDYFNHQDVWEFDPATNVWSQKADLPGQGRYAAVGFSIGNKGYIGTGYNTNYLYLNDFYEFDPITNVWTSKASLPGFARCYAVGFGTTTKGYIGTGFRGYSNPLLDDFWEYNPTTDSWTPIANYGGGIITNAVAFNIGSKGYVGTGQFAYGNFNNVLTKEFWEYNPATGVWTRKADFGGTARQEDVGFSIGSKGYIGGGYDGIVSNPSDYWEYNPANDSWVQSANFTALGRRFATAFSVGTKAYIGTGDNSICLRDIYEFTPGGCTSIPASPIIAGPNAVCLLTSASYTATSSGAVTYTWTTPTGITITSGQGTSSITTAVAAGTISGNVTCSATNTCGTSAITNYMVTKKPQTPTTITGPLSVCGLTTAQYSIPVAFGATSYTWTVPTGMTIISGSGTIAITVSIATTFAGGAVKVTAVNACGFTTPTSLLVYGKSAPSTITGPSNVCGSTTATYTCSTVPNATSYLWTIPSTWSIVSGQNTNTIVVHLPANVNSINYAGSVRVQAISACGVSNYNTITVNYCKSLQTANNSEVDNKDFMSIYPNPASTEFTVSLNPNQSNLEMEVYDVLGNKVINTILTNQTSTINIEQLSIGLYFVRLTDANSNIIYTQRLVKE